MNPPMPYGERRQRGGMLLGFVIGLVVGLALAVAVALYISNAPLPFVTKVRPPSAGTTPPADGKMSDPNKAFNVGTSPAAPAGGTAAPSTPAPPAMPLPPPAKAGPAPTADAAPTKDEPLPESSRFQLQAGAFKSPDDADAMRAQLAMIGLDARIFPIEQGGQTLYRVRLGPYGQLEDVNRIRKLLADNNIEAQIVRLR
jgi:cell division protein FtsN